MEWPAQSPDLNTTENLWADIKEAVHVAKPRKFWNVVQLAWAAIPVDHCHKLVNSMSNRCKEVIRNHGNATKY